MRLGIGIGIGFGGAAPFNLAAWYSAGIKFHFDAATGVTKDGSNRVSAWTNLEGTTGNNVSQGTGASQPLWVASDTPAGTPCVSHDDSARVMQTTTATNHSNAAYTFFAVRKIPGANANGIWFHSDLGGTVGARLDIAAAASRTVFFPAVTLAGGAHGGVYQVECWRLAASGGYGTALDTKEHYINGVSQTVTGTGNMTQGTGLWRFGNSASLARWAEVAAAPGTLMSVSDCQAIMAGLMRKHGVS